MRTACRVAAVGISPAARERILDKFFIGQLVEGSIKIDAYISAGPEVLVTKGILTIKESRSYPQLKTYWLVCKWLEDNTPEQITSRVGILSAKAWHEHLKSAAGVKTVNFEDMEQAEFQEYFEFVKKWVQVRFEVSVEEIIEYQKQED